MIRLSCSIRERTYGSGVSKFPRSGLTLLTLCLSLFALVLFGCEGVQTERESGTASTTTDSPRAEKATETVRAKPGRAKPDSAKPKSRQAKPSPSKSAPVVRVMFKRLRVQDESRARYSREAFEHWVDEDSDGCDTRREVLRRSNRAADGAGRCGAERGRWASAYDGLVTEDPSSFDIDHLIPLAEAWRSGADRWPDAKREAFANDLHPYSLIAVSASSNRSKGDKDPSQWMPPNSRFHCQYIARWIAVKFRWRLSVDRAEHRALAEGLNNCDNASLRLSLKAAGTR